MTLSFGFTSALRALQASTLGMQTAGNNIANANTAGYSRQRVELSASLPYQAGRGYQIGSGVEVGGVFGMVDQGIERRLRQQNAMVGGAEIDFYRWSEIEGILSEPNGGLSSSLDGFFGAIGQLQTDPADRALRGGVVQAGSALSEGFRMISRRLGEVGQNTFDEVRGLVRQVNERAAVIAKLNGQIVALESNGSTANDLRDTRAQHIQEISKLIDARAVERETGSVDLLVSGHLLVAGDRTTDLSVGKGANGITKVTTGKSATPTTIREGRIAALLQQEIGNLPGLADTVDKLARSTILETNRVHSTGMPRSGPFTSLTAAYGSGDGNGNNVLGDELLSQAGFRFDVQAGALYVAVTNKSTGQMERTRVDIDPASMTLEDVATAIGGIDNISASLDPTGKLRINANSGYGFDFSSRVDPNPDGPGTFGGRSPSIGSQAGGPFDLSGQTFPVTFTVTTGTATAPVVNTVTMQASDFSNAAAATTAELLAAINDDLGTAATAKNIGGRLVLQSAQTGSTAQLTLANATGTPLGALRLSTTTATGRNEELPISLEGTYTGTDDDQYVFVPAGDGQIGSTAGLKVNVYNQAGTLITSLDVGREYEVGKPLEVANGVKVSFGPGNISATDGQAFAADMLADSDTSDLLVAVGMNAFFLGSKASDIEVDPNLLTNPDRLSAAIGTASGDAGNLARWMTMRERTIGDLDQNTLEDFYADLVGDIGFDAAAAASNLESQQQLFAYIEAERQSISGVNIDEEMVSMLQFQQSYDAAARFIAIAQEMTDTLISLGR